MIQVPRPVQNAFHQVLRMIGYWGQASSLAWCTSIQSSDSPTDQCVMPLHLWKGCIPRRSFFSCMLSEFGDARVAWNEVMPMVGVRVSNALHMYVYVWR